MNQVRPPMGTVPPPGYPPPPPASPAPDPRERIARFRALTLRACEFWATALIVVALGGALSLLVAMRLTRVYKSECVVLFRAGMNHTSEEAPADRAMRLAPKLKEMLITRQRLEPLITEFKLYQKIVDSRGMVDAVEEMRNHIGFRGRDSETFVIAFDSDNAEVTQKVTQRLADTVIDEFSRGNVSASAKQLEFLSAEMARADETAEKTNKDLATFLAGHPEFAASANQTGQGALGMMITPPAALAAAAKASGDPQLANLIQQRARIEAEAAAAAGQTPVTPPPAGLIDKIDQLTKARQDAIERMNQAQVDFNDKKAHYTTQHPDYIGAVQTLSDTTAAVKTAEAALGAARSQLPAPPPPVAMSAETRARIEAIQNQIEQRKAQLRAVAAASPAGANTTPRIVELETEWQRLLRTVRDERNAHEDLKVKYDKAKLQASAIAGTGGDQMEVLDAAFLPTRPSKGGRTNAALAGFVLSFVAAVAYAYGRVVFSDVLVDAGDIGALQVIPVLGVMPRIARSGAAGAKGAPGVPGNPPGAEANAAPASAKGGRSGGV